MTLESLDPALMQLLSDAFEVFASHNWRKDTLVNVGVYITKNDDLYYVVETKGTKSKLDALVKGLEAMGWEGIRVIPALDKRGRQP